MRMSNPLTRLAAVLCALPLLAAANVAHADRYYRTYEVTITNITKGQTFTPQLVATHSGRVQLFELGGQASAALEVLAEGGATDPLTADLLSEGSAVGDVQTIGGMLKPGKSATIRVDGTFRHRYLSVAAMLIPTNDTFVSLNRVALPRWGRRTYTALAYDAGTEFNDQNCVNIPGPRCGGAGPSAGPNDTDEGFIYVSNGFHDLPQSDVEGEEVLGPFVYDWRNPVARVTVRRVY